MSSIHLAVFAMYSILMVATLFTAMQDRARIEELERKVFALELLLIAKGNS